MRNRTLRMVVLALAAVLAVTHWAIADDDVVAYRVRPGDTLPLVAAEFYGDHQRTTLWVMVANKLSRPRKLIPGEKLWIPISREITTGKGDTFESLAKAYLGDSARATLLAEYNGIDPAVSLATGTALVLPVRVTHTAAGRETLAQISRWYFGDSKQADMLRTFNQLEVTYLEKDDTLIVPNLRVRVRASKMPAIDAAATARRDQRKHNNALAITVLPRARTAWLQGDFAGVQRVLSSLATKLDYLEADVAAEVGILLGKADVAFGDSPAAIERFRQVLSRKPRDLSTYLESPKVIAVWRQAGGGIRNDAEKRN